MSYLCFKSYWGKWVGKRHCTFTLVNTKVVLVNAAPWFSHALPKDHWAVVYFLQLQKLIDFNITTFDRLKVFVEITCWQQFPWQHGFLSYIVRCQNLWDPLPDYMVVANNINVGACLVVLLQNLASNMSHKTYLSIVYVYKLHRYMH